MKSTNKSKETIYVCRVKQFKNYPYYIGTCLPNLPNEKVEVLYEIDCDNAELGCQKLYISFRESKGGVFNWFDLNLYDLDYLDEIIGFYDGKFLRKLNKWVYLSKAERA